MSVPVTAVFGTSIAEGFTGLNTESHAQQALQAANLPYIGLGKGSESMLVLSNLANHRARYALAASCTDVICEHGVNDGVNSGATTFASMASRFQTLWPQLKGLGAGGKRVWQLTLPPSYNTSTDGWTTEAGQGDAPGNTARVLINDWIRAGAPQDGAGNPVAPGTSGAIPNPNLWSHFETADAAETARNSGKWKAVGRNVTDAATSGSTVTSATANFTVDDIGKSVRIAGAGAAGALLQFVTIFSVQSSTQATLSSAAPTAVTGATMNIRSGFYTTDGVHPVQPAHALMASAIQTDLIVSAFGGNPPPATPKAFLSPVKVGGVLSRVTTP